ncbi:MAG: class I SAM-dependent methyltransferase family protein [Nanoarchaeota archaeon]
MGQTLKVRIEDGEKAKQFLQQKGWLDTTKLVGRTAQRYLIFGLNDGFKASILEKQFPGSKIESKALPAPPKKLGDLKQTLNAVVPKQYVDDIIKSYDTIGDIAILQIPPKLENFKLQIAHALKRTQLSIKVVARKIGKVGSKDELYRLTKLEILTGEQRLTTTHKEHGITMKIDLDNVYFSPKSSNERLRVAKLTKPEENVLVMFAGVGPSALIISEFQPNCHIWAVEINPIAIELMKENVRLNRAGNITVIKGDVLKEVPKLGILFDRIVMPFPERNWDFLNLAIETTAPQGVIHFYAFAREDKVKETIKKIEDAAKDIGKSIEILDWTKAGSYAPHMWRYVFDIRVL